MGAGVSSEDEGNFGALQPLQSKSSKSSWKTGKRSVLHRWQRRQLQSHVFAVVRHAERADSVYAFYKGGRWTQTDDFNRYPADPPLSDAGLQAAAEETAEVIQDFAAHHSTSIPIVVTSPYLRCVQTAAEVCRELGPKARILIDKGLGEVFGPSIMGEAEPLCPVRPIDQIVQYCRQMGVRCMSRAIGEWPTWPEDLKSARRRYAHRFLEYLRRSTVTRRNFVIVTHGDCVGVAMSLMPSMVGKRIEKIEFGGMILASRRVPGALAPTGEDKSVMTSSPSKKPSRKGLFSSVLPSSSSPATDMDDDEAAMESEAELDDRVVWRTLASMDSKPAAGSWEIEEGSDGATGNMFKGPTVREFLPPEPPKASDGWNVETFEIVSHEKADVGNAGEANVKSSGSVFSRKVSNLVKSGKYSRPQLEALLGDLSDQPLGGSMPEGGGWMNRPFDGALERGNVQGFTQTSFSTYMFGASDFQSEIGSELSDLTSVLNGNEPRNLSDLDMSMSLGLEAYSSYHPPGSRPSTFDGKESPVPRHPMPKRSRGRGDMKRPNARFPGDQDSPEQRSQTASSVIFEDSLMDYAAGPQRDPNRSLTSPDREFDASDAGQRPPSWSTNSTTSSGVLGRNPHRNNSDGLYRGKNLGEDRQRPKRVGSPPLSGAAGSAAAGSYLLEDAILCTPDGPDRMGGQGSFKDSGRWRRHLTPESAATGDEGMVRTGSGRAASSGRRRRRSNNLTPPDSDNVSCSDSVSSASSPGATPKVKTPKRSPQQNLTAGSQGASAAAAALALRAPHLGLEVIGQPKGSEKTLSSIEGSVLMRRRQKEGGDSPKLSLPKGEGSNLLRLRQMQGVSSGGADSGGATPPSNGGDSPSTMPGSFTASFGSYTADIKHEAPSGGSAAGGAGGNTGGGPSFREVGGSNLMRRRQQAAAAAAAASGGPPDQPTAGQESGYMNTTLSGASSGAGILKRLAAGEPIQKVMPQVVSAAASAAGSLPPMQAGAAPATATSPATGPSTAAPSTTVANGASNAAAGNAANSAPLAPPIFRAIEGSNLMKRRQKAPADAPTSAPLPPLVSTSTPPPPAPVPSGPGRETGLEAAPVPPPPPATSDAYLQASSLAPANTEGRNDSKDSARGSTGSCGGTGGTSGSEHAVEEVKPKPASGDTASPAFKGIQGSRLMQRRLTGNKLTLPSAAQLANDVSPGSNGGVGTAEEATKDTTNNNHNSKMKSNNDNHNGDSVALVTNAAAVAAPPMKGAADPPVTGPLDCPAPAPAPPVNLAGPPGENVVQFKSLESSMLMRRRSNSKSGPSGPSALSNPRVEAPSVVTPTPAAPTPS